ncbi:MAG: Capsule biosynthesis protein CapD proenzyme [Burkholderia plantarii]|nr:MAG: Capsule biosynthesis protein CapD proenzyme [Burkholderia plantarii]
MPARIRPLQRPAPCPCPCLTSRLDPGLNVPARPASQAWLARAGLAVAASALLTTLAACSGTGPQAGTGTAAGAGAGTNATNAASATLAAAAPGTAGNWADKPALSARREIIVAANPLAARAGYDILKAGGTAVDAAIAAQMVLTLVEPQASGLGGGAFLLHADGHKTEAYDGRETAPAAATEPLPAGAAGSRLVGTPGVLRMLELAHRAHGKLPWARLFQPALRLAERGFPVSARLAAQIASEPRLRDDPAARAYFYDKDGRPKAAGTTLKNPALAATFRQIARLGANALYTGPIARDIVADPDFVTAPGGNWQALVSPVYLVQRARQIRDTSLGHADPGLPAGASLVQDDDRSTDAASATQLAIADRYGNTLSMTSTLDARFGSRLMVRGFLLNSALGDFSAATPATGRQVANRIEGGKRPRSSMAPELVFDRGTQRVAMALGSAGGASIAIDVAQTLVGMIDWGMTVQQAIALPGFGSRNGPTELEAGRVSPTLIDGLRQRGHDVRLVARGSGLGGVQRISVDGLSVWLGGADPRDESVMLDD